MTRAPFSSPKQPDSLRRWGLFPFREQVMLFLTVDAIISNQAFQNERCHICFSLGLDKVEVDGVKLTHQMLNCSYSHWFACD